MTYPISPNIPIPDKKVRSKYPFDLLQVGDSFEFNADDIKLISSAASAFGKAHNKRFLVRTTEDGKARCWRVEERT